MSRRKIINNISSFFKRIFNINPEIQQTEENTLIDRQSLDSYRDSERDNINYNVNLNELSPTIERGSLEIGETIENFINDLLAVSITVNLVNRLNKIVVDKCLCDFCYTIKLKQYIDEKSYCLDTLFENGECSICLDDYFGLNCLKLDCGHCFHKTCFLKWNKYTCPYCRQIININYDS